MHQSAAAGQGYRWAMHFMLLILGFLLFTVVWGFFHSNPRGVPQAPLAACNLAIIALAAGAAMLSAFPLHADALATRPDERALAVYLAVMAGGTAFMIVVASGGLVRNLFVFPLSRRRSA